MCRLLQKEENINEVIGQYFKPITLFEKVAKKQGYLLNYEP